VTFGSYKALTINALLWAGIKKANFVIISSFGNYWIE